jgi:hypothetical protein
VQWPQGEDAAFGDWSAVLERRRGGG